ncbi:unnamed protein product [Periconia digitata]|uniref:AB hydrolase-1 domain-containing protein n=1 Tax=Periconia digitata TaxID=1303443 RepID=A0A9W4UW36_9PLEO|nr:unnamed protein product [Periconia digitata]
MATPQSKTFMVKAGHTYSYTHVTPQDSSKPTFLLVHGFPNCADDWKFQIRDLAAAGYGVLAPDLLGYAGTDKPLAIEEYKMSNMTAQVVEILEHEGLKKVVGVGHDW